MHGLLISRDSIFCPSAIQTSNTLFIGSVRAAAVLSGENSLQGAVREVKEELGITLAPEQGKLIYQFRREDMQDFYDVWLFHADIDIKEMVLQKTEVVDVQWVNQDKLLNMFQKKQLHPLITYIDTLIS